MGSSIFGESIVLPRSATFCPSKSIDDWTKGELQKKTGLTLMNLDEFGPAACHITSQKSSFQVGSSQFVGWNIIYIYISVCDCVCVCNINQTQTHAEIYVAENPLCLAHLDHP